MRLYEVGDLIPTTAVEPQGITILEEEQPEGRIKYLVKLSPGRWAWRSVPEIPDNQNGSLWKHAITLSSNQFFKVVELSQATPAEDDPVNHPAHYNMHPSGVECITITEHMSYTLGNAVKYIWRADLKGDAIQDLKKARFYLDREIAKREKAEEQR